MALKGVGVARIVCARDGSRALARVFRGGTNRAHSHQHGRGRRPFESGDVGGVTKRSGLVVRSIKTRLADHLWQHGASGINALNTPGKHRLSTVRTANERDRCAGGQYKKAKNHFPSVNNHSRLPFHPYTTRPSTLTCCEPLSTSVVCTVGLSLLTTCPPSSRRVTRLMKS